MQISEIFKSCQGEGVYAGLPTVFVRLSGCNLAMSGTSCSWCDTVYAQEYGGRKMSVAEVMKRVGELSDGCRRVCITGGEPLYQASGLRDLVDRLRFRDYFVEVFTNSTLEPPGWFFLVDSWVIDVKCPSSGVSEKCLKEWWLKVVRGKDLVKFVVATSGDLDYVVEALRLKRACVPVALSPMVPNCPDSLFGDVLISQRKWLQTVWGFCVEHDYRFSFQNHKLVFGNKRGV